MVIAPRGHLVLAVGERQQITRAIVGKTVCGHAHIGFTGLAVQGVVAIKHHITDLIGVAGRAGHFERVAEFLHAVIRIAASQQTVQIIIGHVHAHVVGVHAVREPVFDVVGISSHLPDIVADGNEQPLIVILIGDTHAGAVRPDHQLPDGIVGVVDGVSIRVKGLREITLIVVTELSDVVQGVNDLIQRTAIAVIIKCHIAQGIGCGDFLADGIVTVGSSEPHPIHHLGQVQITRKCS